MPNDTFTHRPLRVLIAGAGVAGLEAAFALQALAADRVAVTLMSPSDAFTYRPLSIGEPFSSSWAERYPLGPLAEAAGAALVRDTLASVDAERRTVRTGCGAEMAYDTLVVGLGASLHAYSAHVTNVDDAQMDELLHGLVQDIEAGYVRRLAIIVPTPTPWPLPAYELALQASDRAWGAQADLDVTMLTGERMALEAFGATASHGVARLLNRRRITVVTSAQGEVLPGRVIARPGGRSFAADRIVAFPQLTGPDVAGVPRDGGGFIPIDAYGRVRGLDHVWAAGDATDYPVKHGGVAAQLADTAAQGIAALAGVAVEPQPFAPVIQGVLMTGGTACYLRATPAGPDRKGESVFAELTQGAVPPKLSARYLGPHLAGHPHDGLRHQRSLTSS